MTLGQAEQEAFDNTKRLLTFGLTLVRYNLDRELLLLCDTSERGVGALLIHKMHEGSGKPVILNSKTLQNYERRYAHLCKQT